jgi:hypothetical protein
LVLWLILFHDFDFAPGKIIFQAFSLRDKILTRITPINLNSICANSGRARHSVRAVVRAQTYARFITLAAGRGLPALPSPPSRPSRDTFFQFVPPPLRVKFFA